MWRSHPVFGVGPDNFRRLRGRYTGQSEFDDRIHANSLYLETLATSGLLGIIALLSALFSLFFRFSRVWRELQSDRDKLLLFGIILCFVAFLLHGFVDYFLSFTPTYALFWIVAGLGAGLTPLERRS